MKIELIVTTIGLLTSISSIIFSYLAFKKNEKETQKKDGKKEGIMITDICYIKTCFERVLDNLNKVDERHQKIIERLIKVEESVINVTKRVDEMYKINDT